MIELIGKNVVVETIETIYEGNLVEVNEEEVHLESESGWLVIPLQKVINIYSKLE
jgi:hypothetical protein